jgi:hypothetical protein
MLYSKGIEECYSTIACNIKTPAELLESFYETYEDDLDILVSLGYNKGTPETILRELFKRDVLEINKALATNASVPIELLDILKVDTRLQNELAQNEIFVKAYETVLDYDRKAIE